MPRCQEPKKDVVSCDKLRVAANERLSADFRMGVPTRGNALVSCGEHIATGRQARELKHLSTSRKGKKNSIPQVAASEPGIAQTDQL